MAFEYEQLYSFEEWKRRGYHVIKGKKHIGRNNDGVCLFSEQQVERNTYCRPREAWIGSSDYEGSWESSISFGDTQDMGFFGM